MTVKEADILRDDGKGNGITDHLYYFMSVCCEEPVTVLL